LCSAHLADDASHRQENREPNNLILRDAANAPLLEEEDVEWLMEQENWMVEWFDDLKLGMRFRSGEVTVSKQDILRFAAEFDPQPFHLDEAAAKTTILEGLAASGWHTAALAMRLAITTRPFGPHPLFGAGVDELRWLKPVRPGDTLRLEGEVVELVPSRTKPQGVVRVKWTAYNQSGEAVYTFNPIGIVPRRPA